MLAMAILATVGIVWLAIIVVGGAFVFLLISKWVRNEPITKQKEEMRDAFAWRSATRGMSKGLAAELLNNPSMGPQEIADFIEQWGAGSVDEIAQKIAAQKQKELDDIKAETTDDGE